jgi:hypothetical protein
MIPLHVAPTIEIVSYTSIICMILIYDTPHYDQSKRVLRYHPETRIPKEMDAPDDPMAGPVLAASHSGAHAADPSVQPWQLVFGYFGSVVLNLGASEWRHWRLQGSLAPTLMV